MTRFLFYQNVVKSTSFLNKNTFLNILCKNSKRKILIKNHYVLETNYEIVNKL